MRSLLSSLVLITLMATYPVLAEVPNFIDPIVPSFDRDLILYRLEKIKKMESYPVVASLPEGEEISDYVEFTRERIPGKIKRSFNRVKRQFFGSNWRGEIKSTYSGPNAMFSLLTNETLVDIKGIQFTAKHAGDVDEKHVYDFYLAHELGHYVQSLWALVLDENGYSIGGGIFFQQIESEVSRPNYDDQRSRNFRYTLSDEEFHYSVNHAEVDFIGSLIFERLNPGVDICAVIKNSLMTYKTYLDLHNYSLSYWTPNRVSDSIRHYSHVKNMGCI